MNDIKQFPLSRLGDGFAQAPYLHPGGEEQSLRESQQFSKKEYRPLTDEETRALVRNGNYSDDWRRVLVSSSFEPDLVRRCRFSGLVRIGALEPSYLEFHDLRTPVGLYNSMIVSCDIGDSPAIHNVRYLAFYILDRQVIILNVDEMQTTNHSKFGNGILKEGETEDVRIWLEICNETGIRSVLPFDGMLAADAYLWTKYRSNLPLMARFKEMTDSLIGSRRGYYGTVGECTIIKHCRIIKDVRIGPHAYIKGVNKLKNLTINSSAEEGTQIGEGVELVNGIIGSGCRIFYGVKAVRFILGTCSNLKYGARLLNSYLGDNSTISCCEVLNSLIFCSHEQHHNNSFLCATLVQGQSNIAAGTTAGSNHNSRANDGEFVARRGFWPGLCTNFKHNCRFASFVLVAKGNYSYELDIPFPFALVSLSENDNSLRILPGFWFLYNMYALMRNSWKWRGRDRRIDKRQNIEFDCLAPDTVDEMFNALEILERETGKAWFIREGTFFEAIPSEDLRGRGKILLNEEPEVVDSLKILGEGMEHSARKVRILKASQGYAIYSEMIHYYCIKSLLSLAEKRNMKNLSELIDNLEKEGCIEQSSGGWINMGGQLVGKHDLEELISRIVSKETASWSGLHLEYDKLWERYPIDRAAHAYLSLIKLHGTGGNCPSQEEWKKYLEKARDIQVKVASLTRESRAKDYSNPFRSITFDSPEEKAIILGNIDDNSFITVVEEETRTFSNLVDKFTHKT